MRSVLRGLGLVAALLSVGTSGQETQASPLLIQGPSLTQAMQTESTQVAAAFALDLTFKSVDRRGGASEVFTRALLNAGESAPKVLSAHADALRDLVAASGPYPSIHGSPVRVFEEQAGHPTVVLGAIGVDTVFNTQRTTARERAAAVTSKTLLPVMRNLSAAVGDATGLRLAVVVVYGALDFSAQQTIGVPSTEVLIGVAQAPLAAKLRSNDVAEDDFVSNADFFLLDQETPFRKIRVVLQ